MLFQKARCLVILLTLSFGLLISSCELFGPGDDGFGTTAGPILFISDESSPSQLYSMNEDGSNVQQLTSDPNVSIRDARWSPDGRRIAVVAQKHTGNQGAWNNLYTVNRRGKDLIHLSEPNNHLNGISDRNPIWTPDGRHILFRSGGGCCSVPPAGYPLIIGADGKDKRQIQGRVREVQPSLAGFDNSGNTFVGSWYSLFSSQSNDQPYRVIGRWSVAGDSLGALGEKALDFWNPSISSSGDYIVYRSYSYTSGERKVMIVDKNFENPVEVYVGEYLIFSPHQWSSNDSAIIGSSYKRTIIIKIDGSGQLDVTPFPDAYSTVTSWR